MTTVNGDKKIRATVPFFRFPEVKNVVPLEKVEASI